MLLFDWCKHRVGNRLEFAFDLRVFDGIRGFGLRGEVRVIAQLAEGKRVGDGDELPEREIRAVHVDGLVVFARYANELDLHDEETGPVSRPRLDQLLRARKNTVTAMEKVVVPVPGAALTNTSTVSFAVSTNGRAVGADARTTPPVWPMVEAWTK